MNVELNVQKFTEFSMLLHKLVEMIHTLKTGKAKVYVPFNISYLIHHTAMCLEAEILAKKLDNRIAATIMQSNLLFAKIT